MAFYPYVASLSNNRSILSIRAYSIKIVLKKLLKNVAHPQRRIELGLLAEKSVALPTESNLMQINGVMACTIAFCTLV